MKKSSHKDIHNNFFTPLIYHNQAGESIKNYGLFVQNLCIFVSAFG